MSELQYYVKKSITDYLVNKVGKLSDLEKDVIVSVASSNTLINKLNTSEAEPTLGQRVADKVASFGGSWTFIISFGTFITIWIAVNVFWFLNRGYDPYPFILLNLILSCLSALQAPVIMMSRNRTEERDRSSARNDHMINLKTELEIKNLNERVEQLISYRQKEYSEIREFHKDILESISRLESNKSK